MRAAIARDDGSRPTPSVDPDEIARFSALAARWWDPAGPMRPLHAMNPARVGWIAERIARRFGPDARPAIVDVGCGAGIATEALAALGFPALGIDASADAIAAARGHAAGSGLPAPPEYRAMAAEDLIAEGRTFPVVVSLETIEHAADPAAFAAALRALIAPGGMLFASTLDRTARSWATAILGAEYALRLLPVGTHDWRRFLRPSEFAALLRANGLRVSDCAGLAPDPRTGAWRTTRDARVNYLICAEA